MHVTFSLNTGGVEKLVLELANRMDKDLFSSSVSCLHNEGSLSKEFNDAGIKTFYLNKKNGLDYFLPFRLAKILREEKIDIMHTHDSTANLYAIVAAKIAGRSKIFNTEHGGIYFETVRKRIINRLLCVVNNAMVCVSESVRHDLIKMGLPEQKLKVISNCLDSKRFDITIDKRKKRCEVGLSDSDFVICCIGRLSKEKNYNMLFDAVKTVLEKIPQARFLVVGDGPLRTSLKEKTRDLAALGKVVFLGTRNDIPEILKASDCFVACSNFESFGLSVLEAMAAGVPVVSTCAGGLKEIVKDEETGILIAQNDTPALIEGICRIKEDGTLRQKIISNAKKMVKDSYEINKMIKGYEKLYLNS